MYWEENYNVFTLGCVPGGKKSWAWHRGGRGHSGRAGIRMHCAGSRSNTLAGRNACPSRSTSFRPARSRMARPRHLFDVCTLDARTGKDRTPPTNQSMRGKSGVGKVMSHRRRTVTGRPSGTASTIKYPSNQSMGGRAANLPLLQVKEHQAPLLWMEERYIPPMSSWV